VSLKAILAQTLSQDAGIWMSSISSANIWASSRKSENSGPPTTLVYSKISIDIKLGKQDNRLRARWYESSIFHLQEQFVYLQAEIVRAHSRETCLCVNIRVWSVREGLRLA